MFDINLRQSYYDRQIIHDLLGVSNVLKLNDAELPVVARLFDLLGEADAVVNSLLDDYPLHVIALTRGPHGSVLFARESRKHPAELRNMVTSPGGTSAEAIYQMEKGGLRTVLSKAVWAAYQRATALGRTARE